ncbi:DC-STAMP domain-containing protein 2 [Antennarius striatus]|uniref:DC-STAMP domain-containing protein 2 n=1 Tax=Antennarius striatus TaxID=241820 RepID=UPI0035B2A8AB
MKSGKRKRPPMKTDVTVQVEDGGGVTQKARGPKRSTQRSAWSRVKGQLFECGRNLLAFLGGLLLASLYGLLAVFLQKQPLWFSVYITLGLASMAAFGMGVSSAGRASVLLLLPTLCSAQGRNFLLFLFTSLLLLGPLANTLENTERAAASLLCGAELAANQTQELAQRAASPLFAGLDKIREITGNARAAAGRVQKFIETLTDSVRHVASTLRNVLHFLVDIGDLCNKKLGTPYRKCQEVFNNARTDCLALLGDFDFMCDVLTVFRPLCNLAQVTTLFCLIPSYVAEQLKTRLAAPTIAAFERMKQEFDFNISASMDFDLDANSSQSLQEASQNIMADISSELHLFQMLSKPLAYGSLIMLAWSFMKAVWYRRKYLRDLNFDNVYITNQFKELDRLVSSRGGASLLPITRREARTYITPFAFRLTTRERRGVFMGVVSVLKHLVMGGVLVALDYLVFWMLDQVHRQVDADIVARAPVTLEVQVNGSGYASDIFRDMVASFNILQRGNITVISRKCLLEPSQPDWFTSFVLGFLLGLSLVIAVVGGLAQRCRRVVCASFHPEREQERIRFLWQKIRDERRTEGIALMSSATMGPPDQRGGRNLLQRLPGGARLSHVLGLSSISCRACGEVMRPWDKNVATCQVPRCPGIYCRSCFHSLRNTCLVCVRPTTFLDEAEADSSDDSASFCSAGSQRPDSSQDQNLQTVTLH